MSGKQGCSLIHFVVLFVVGCSGCENNPCCPMPGTLEGDFEIQVASNGGVVGDALVPLLLLGASADSISIWNLDGDVICSQMVFVAEDSITQIGNWELLPGDGRKIVQAKFFNAKGDQSEIVESTVILDLTAPDNPPELVSIPSGSLVPVATQLSWNESSDNWSSPSGLIYSLRLGPNAQNLQEIFLGSETSVLVPDLHPSQRVFWGLKCTDTVGNSTEETIGFFDTWDIDVPQFKFIEPGSFFMGSPEWEFDGSSWERQHEVQLTHPFLFASTELVYKQFLPVLQWACDRGKMVVTEEGVFDEYSGEQKLLFDFGVSSSLRYSNGQFSYLGTSLERIVTELTWYGAAVFCDWLNELGGYPEMYSHGDTWSTNYIVYNSVGFRLPTEAEWEYCCRGGTTTSFANGDMTDPYCADLNLGEIGWYCGNMDLFEFLPGAKISNAWGLFDMHGGVSEWCYDWASEYPAVIVTDPVAENPDFYRVIRGGGTFRLAYAEKCRSGSRAGGYPNIPYGVGVRLAFSGGS